MSNNSQSSAATAQAQSLLHLLARGVELDEEVEEDVDEVMGKEVGQMSVM